MKAIVTGGAGFIGSNLVDELVNRNFKVKVLDNLSTGNLENINKKAEFLNSDIVELNQSDLSNIINGFDFVFHLSALPRITPSFTSPLEHHKANIDATLKLIIASKKANIKKIIYSGSSSVYGNPKKVPTSENDPVDPLNPYALQKYTAEQYGLLLGRHLEMPFISLRYMNPYGKRSFNLNNPYNAYTSVIGIFENCYKSGAVLKITGDGSQRRDFIDIRDVVEANIVTALSDIEFDIFNIGTGKTYSILEVAKMFGKNYEFIEQRKGEASITQADISNIQKKTSWRPNFKLEEYIRNLL